MIAMTNKQNTFIFIKAGPYHSTSDDKQSDGVVQQLGQYQLLKCYIEILEQNDPASSFMFESVQDISGHNNKPGLAVFKQLYVAFSATKKAWDSALQIMVVDRTFLKVSSLTKLSYLLSLVTVTTTKFCCCIQL